MFLVVYLSRFALDAVFGYHDIPASVPVPVFACGERGKNGISNTGENSFWASRNLYSREGRAQSASHLKALGQVIFSADDASSGSRTRVSTRKSSKSVSIPAVTFAVSSECTNIKLRQTIRDSWGAIARRRGLAVVFFVGSNIRRFKCDPDLIGKEYEVHKDVVQLNLEETYDNLSRKTREIFSYVRRIMSPSGYVAKLDDDVYVDVDALVGRLAKASVDGIQRNHELAGGRYLPQASTFLAPSTTLKVYLGFMHPPVPVIRIPGCKWYDPYYPINTRVQDDIMSMFEPKADGDLYPKYAGGMFYVLSTALVRHLDTYEKARGFADGMPADGNGERRGLGLMSGISALPVWANEDATMGTWIHAANMQAQRDRRQKIDASNILYVHEPAIYPARIVEAHKMHPPIAIHMDWATGQHIEQNDGIPSNRQERNAKLLLAAHLNLHREGLPFGECSNKFKKSRALRRGSGVSAPPTMAVKAEGDSGEGKSSGYGEIDKEEWGHIVDRERRHGLLSSSLYRRPEGLVQTGHAEAMDAKCHAHSHRDLPRLPSSMIK